MTDRAIEGEEEIVQRYLVPLAAGFPGAYGLIDDCATIHPSDGQELVVTTDALVQGVHFLPGESADAIGWKALAVNVSDLVAKGAKPLAYLMSLSLPEAPRQEWMQGLAGGLARAQEAFGIALAGGDTDRTPGHLGVAITAFGTIPAATMVKRSGARPGDRLYVSGPIGDAALGLRLLQTSGLSAVWDLKDEEARYLLDRLRYPAPRVALASVLAELASASMDISDGFGKDLERLCRASHVGAEVDTSAIPVSETARRVLERGGVTLVELLAGGEDYEILAAVTPDRCAAFEAAARSVMVPCAMVGQVVTGDVTVVTDSAGRPTPLRGGGWDHFPGSPKAGG